MRVVVTGASGNVGTALLRHLQEFRPEWSLVGICRRTPEPGEPAYDRVTWVEVDLSEPACEPTLLSTCAGADAVVHLAWLIQPARDQALLERTNVVGTGRVFDAAVAAGVGHVVHMSSVGAYSRGPKDREVAESWPTDGVASATSRSLGPRL